VKLEEKNDVKEDEKEIEEYEEHKHERKEEAEVEEEEVGDKEGLKKEDMGSGGSDAKEDTAHSVVCPTSAHGIYPSESKGVSVPVSTVVMEGQPAFDRHSEKMDPNFIFKFTQDSETTTPSILTYRKISSIRPKIKPNLR
jgi:hypothetical protein